MRHIKLFSIASKGYTFEELRDSFKEKSDVYYALLHKLFDIDATFNRVGNDPVVRFLDDVEGRIVCDFNYRFGESVENIISKGNIVYRFLDMPYKGADYRYPYIGYVISPRAYNKLHTYRSDITDKYELATIVDVYHPHLTAAEKKKVYEEMTAAARRDGFDSLHAYVLAIKAERRAWIKKCEKEKRESIRRGDTRFLEAMGSYRLYANLGGFLVVPNSESNSVVANPLADRYSNSCRYTKWVYTYYLYIRKGWHFDRIGGLLTMWRGKFNRLGMPCEWIEQYKWEFRTVKGYLVRGEHIKAKSLKEAIAINREHRQSMLADAIKQRVMAKARRKGREESVKEAEPYMNNVITFADSLAAGNCKPGTRAFKENVEAYLDKTVETLTVRDIIPLAFKFNAVRYVQRIFNHKEWPVIIDNFR